MFTEIVEYYNLVLLKCTFVQCAFLYSFLISTLIVLFILDIVVVLVINLLPMFW